MMPFSITAIWGNHRKERVKPEPFYGKCPVVMLKNDFYASRTLCQMAIMPNNFKQNLSPNATTWLQTSQGEYLTWCKTVKHNGHSA